MLQTQSGYSLTSIVVHWLTAIFVVALFLTGEGRGSVRSFHIAAGAIVGVFLIWRLVRRMMHGRTSKPDQHPILNRVSLLVIWGLLLSILVATITGYLAPWTRGSSINIFDIVSLPSPMTSNHFLHEMAE